MREMLLPCAGLLILGDAESAPCACITFHTEPASSQQRAVAVARYETAVCLYCCCLSAAGWHDDHRYQPTHPFPSPDLLPFLPLSFHLFYDVSIKIRAKHFLGSTLYFIAYRTKAIRRTLKLNSMSYRLK